MPEDTNDGGATFTPPATQADLDRVIEQRLARERSKYADYDALKEKAAKFDQVDEATKTELQKALDAVAEKDAKLAELPRQIRSQVVRFASMATQKGFIDPEDALSGLPSGIDLADDAAVTTALEALAARKPHLVRPQQTQRVKERPKPKPGESAGDGDGGDDLKGKERAAAALRQFRNTR